MALNINDVIRKPLVTEKTAKQMDKNVYWFVIDKRATKTDVKKAIETIFSQSGAKVKKVNIQNVEASPKRVGQFAGYTASFKKAIVSLSAGSIPIYGAQGVENTSDEAQTAKKKKGIKIINTEKILKEAEQKAGE